MECKQEKASQAEWPTCHGKNPVPVSVVVCARNREAMIGRCLDSVRAAQPAEVIVVDGNSTDRTAEIARAKAAEWPTCHGKNEEWPTCHGQQFRVVSDKGAGLGAARRLGASLAQNDYVVFVDTDVVVEPDTLRQMLAEAQEKGYGALQAELRTLADMPSQTGMAPVPHQTRNPSGPHATANMRPSYWQKAERWRRSVQMRKGVAAVLGCQITLVRRDLLVQVGFDEAFRGAAEDADFCFRARATGAVIAHSDRAVAYHEDRCTIREFIEQKIWHGRGLARLAVRYGRRYLRQAAGQVDNSLSATRVNARYLPYIVTNWSFTALGIALELARIAGDAGLRKRLCRVRLVDEGKVAG